MPEQVTKKRCAIYTRKSVEDGLDMDFNSLDAQRLACENYISSQMYNGWTCLPEHYDDGGVSGGTLERPALKKLLADAEAGLIDIIVIYKIDRLSRSISDFADLSKKFDEWNISFCSVTQEINTSTSSGRMMLNILMTFAQYEREIIAERIKDKMAASRKQGKWVGGTVPYGYIAENRCLIPDPERADMVPKIFAYYLRCGSVFQVTDWLNEQGVRTKKGKAFTPDVIYRMLNNYTYRGEVNYKGTIYAGEHQRLVDDELWDGVQKTLYEQNRNKDKSHHSRRTINAPLKGLLRCGHCGGSLGATYAKKNGNAYTYYACISHIKHSKSRCPIKRLPAGDLEAVVIEQIGIVFRTPTFVAQVANQAGMDIQDVMNALSDLKGFWQDLFPIEQNRLLKLMIDYITVTENGLDIKVKTSGMRSLIKEIQNVAD